MGGIDRQTIGLAVHCGTQRTTSRQKSDLIQYKRVLTPFRSPQAVVDECSVGDPVTASERLVFAEGIPVLAMMSQTRTLAQDLLRKVGLPPKAAIDAVHIVTAAQNEIDYLLTWN